MKKLMKIFMSFLSVLLRVFLPLQGILGKIYFPARLKADIINLDLSVQCDGRIRVKGTKNIVVGSRCRLGCEVEFETEENGRIILGNDIRINRGCTLVSYTGITIGDFAIIGEYVSIRDANHGMKMNKPMRFQRHETLPISIGKDVWIGRGCCILPGVTIGEGSVIGANSVVTNDIPAFSIAAGVPAKVIRERRGT